MKYILPVLLAFALAGLSACGNDTPSIGKGMITGVLGQIGKERPKPPTAEQIRATATPEALAQIGKPVMLAQLPDIGLADILIFVQANAPYTTWASSDGVSFVFRHGVLTGTRGMGFDLMTADVEETLLGLARGSGQGVRVHRYLDGENQLQPVAFQCRYIRQSNGVISEFCYSLNYQFENQYVLNAQGQIVKSRQWIGPKRGYLVSERLS